MVPVVLFPAVLEGNANPQLPRRQAVLWGQQRRAVKFPRRVDGGGSWRARVFI